MMRVIMVLLALSALVASAAHAQEDVADVPAQDQTVKDQPKQRYFLIGDTTKTQEKDFALLIVMPGGDGSAEYNSFVKRIYKNALPDGYLVAQLVAVSSNNPRQTVWPTERDKDPKQSFSTESFITNVVNEVKAKHKIDETRVFTLSWSSGGPAAYAASLTKDTPITGSFVAMSIFPQGVLPPIANAKGQKYFIYHSQQDKKCQYGHTRIAKTQLTKGGAAVTVQDYQGGHGWFGDMWGDIAGGIEWLEKTKAPTTAPTAAPTKG
jgi:poly(3-hydroxybutyrate) depolymerase